ncbi:MAG TPA: hypothetical protein VFX48_06840, partial [Saprospiraceae bacterium]|nr:hypothetical protein [Saprospiraceae bacterium]
YIMEIPSFVGNVRARYDLDLRDWRDRSVFDAPVSSIEEIRVSYPDNPSESFIIRKGEQKMDLYDFANPAQKLEVRNPKTLKAYLDHFTGIGSEGIQNQNPKKDLIISQKPYCTIQLKMIGQSDPVICRFIPIQTDTLGQLVLFPQDEAYRAGSFFRMHVDRSDGDFLLVQYPNVQPLFALRSELQSR